MTTKSCDVKKPIIIRKVPVFLKKEQIFLKPKNRDQPLLKIRQPLFKEDIIYESQSGDFLKAECPNITIINKLNLLTNCSRTVAKCKLYEGATTEKCSNNVAKLIGQKNYDTVFSALCSVINQELKIRGILALLTAPKTTGEASTQTGNTRFEYKSRSVDIACQTDESSMDIFLKRKQRKRVKRQSLAPYVVQDTEFNLKKVIVNPHSYKKLENKVIVNLADLKKHFNENLKEHDEYKNRYGDKNPEYCENFDMKFGGNTVMDCEHYEGSALPKPELCDDISMDSMSINSVNTDRVFNGLELFENVDKHTKDEENFNNQTMGYVGHFSTKNDHQEISNMIVNQFKVKTLDNTEIILRSKPEDDFHLVTKENLKFLSPENRKKLLLHQAYIDWKYCLTQDEDGNLPIHVAVLNDDLDLLRRQCLALKIRNELVDIPAAGNWTAFKMSIYGNKPKCAEMLLHFGADLLLTDDENRTALHYAAELSADLLRLLISYCKDNPGKILEDYEELWKPHFDDLSKKDILSKHLLSHMCKKCDCQGYTPLMLASKLGKHENVKELVEVAPDAVNTQMPTSGNTALYLAVGAACTNAAASGNRSKVDDDFRKTIDILMENGADPGIDNHSGSSVNVLLTEFNIAELSMLIANKFTSMRYFDGKMPNSINETKNFDSYMLVKNEDGTVIKEVNIDKSVKAKRNYKNKPVIMENILVSKPPGKRIGRKAKTDGNTDNTSFMNKFSSFLKSAKQDNVVQKVIVSKGDEIKNIKLEAVKTQTVASPVKRRVEIVREPIKSKQPKLTNIKT